MVPDLMSCEPLSGMAVLAAKAAAAMTTRTLKTPDPTTTPKPTSLKGSHKKILISEIDRKGIYKEYHQHQHHLKVYNRYDL